MNHFVFSINLSARPVLLFSAARDKPTSPFSVIHLCRVLYECRTKSACPTLISPPGSRLFHQVDQICAVKENALSRIPILLIGTARKYEENEAGVLDRHGCPSSMFRGTEVDLRNKLCPLLFRQSSGLLGDSRSFLFSDAQLMTRGYGADGLTWWCR